MPPSQLKSRRKSKIVERANRKSQIANRKSQIANRKSQIANRKSQIANITIAPLHYITNQKSEIVLAGLYRERLLRFIGRETERVERAD